MAETTNPKAQDPNTPKPEHIMKLNEIENHLGSLMDNIQKQNLNHSQIQNTLFSLQQQMDLVKSKVELDKQKNDTLLKHMSIVLSDLKNLVKTKYRTVEDVPGIRVPRWYQVTLLFDINASLNPYQSQPISQNEGSIGISPDGPFIVTQVTPLWQPLDLDYTQYSNPYLNTAPQTDLENVVIGRYLPTTIYGNVAKNLGRVNSTSNGYNTPSLTQLDAHLQAGVPPIPLAREDFGVFNDLPEFDITVKIDGNGRLWNDLPTASEAFFGNKGNPVFLGTLGIFEKNDRIDVIAKMSRNTNIYGRLKLVFHGYQILNPIILADLLGY